jgi:putative radical SAM enzyme (TIGR03279 family)
LLADAGIEICGQIVLCRGINDADELDKSLHDLAILYPRLKSVSVVPSGLTAYRENLYPLIPFDKASSNEVIDQVERINEYYRKKHGKSLFFCSDEFYLVAERDLPSDEYYEDYSQIENGVGMLRSFECEVEGFLKTLSSDETKIKRNVSIATGVASYDFICNMVSKIQKKCKNIVCNVYKIENDFFGRSITVSGLVTGVDMINQLKGKRLGDELLISRNMLRAEGDLFLCDTSLEDLEKELKTKVRVSECDGAAFVLSVLGLEE